MGALAGGHAATADPVRMGAVPCKRRKGAQRRFFWHLFFWHLFFWHLFFFLAQGGAQPVFPECAGLRLFPNANLRV